jgi:bifunctional aspartokinase / homoserine dehydrogenase 1
MNKNNRVLKFGGSSVGKPETIRTVYEIVRFGKKSSEPGLPREGQIKAVVFSAFQGVTNQLIEIAHLISKGQNESALYQLGLLKNKHLIAFEELVKPHVADIKPNSDYVIKCKQEISQLFESLEKIISIPSKKFEELSDSISCYGEILSTTIICFYFKLRDSIEGVVSSCLVCDTRDIIETDSHFTKAKVARDKTYEKIQAYFAKLPHDTLVLATGFIARDEEGRTTTLGRGGSDYTGALVAAAIDAQVLEIWTDVDGILTADPRKVQRTFPLAMISYSEALELCHFGAKVIYPPTLEPVLDKKIPIRILNTFNPSAPGTFVSEQACESKFSITGISSIDEIDLIQVQGKGLIGVPGTSMRVFSAIATAGVSVIMISQASSEYSICVAVQTSEAQKATAELSKEFQEEIKAKLIDPIQTESQLSIVSVVGERMRHRPGLAGQVFNSLGRSGVNVVAIAQGSSELNISTVIRKNQQQKALQAIHDEFFGFRDKKTVHIFLLGTGLIGKTLIKQIKDHLSILSNELRLDFKLNGIANSRKLLLSQEGIEWESALEQIHESDDHYSFNEFIGFIKNSSFPSPIVVDCTASDEVATKYEELLSNHLAVVSANKKAQSSKLTYFQKLLTLAEEKNVPFLYETSVGAGLPVIGTLHDLIRSGDRITRIEAVLSGTLSYIFNCFTGETPFSELVKSAQKAGFTEPDPRDDLNGVDAARKILILARISGANLELSDVEIENLIPSKIDANSSLDEFYAELQKQDSMYLERITSLKASGKRFSYISCYNEGKAYSKLTEIGLEHPFYRLSGTDNAIAFYTDRYHKQPLLIQGPGAGADVTAAGVFADVLRISKPYSLISQSAFSSAKEA